MVTSRKSRRNPARARLADVTGRPTKGGLVQVMFTLSPAQLERLRVEAMRRALARGSGKPDASALLREIIDAWLAKQPRHK